MKHPAIIRLIIVFFFFSFTSAESLASLYYHAKVTASVVNRSPTGTPVYGGTVMVQHHGEDQDYSTSSTGYNYTESFILQPSAGGNPVSITMKAKTNDGYSFSGWYNNADDNYSFESNTPYTGSFNTGTAQGEENAAPYTIFAKFSPIPYDITYVKGDHGNGSSLVEKTNIENNITLKSGTTFTPDIGYQFKEWKVTSLGSTKVKWAMNQTFNSSNLNIGTGYYSSDPGVTLTAQWLATTYQITYDPGDGASLSGSDNPQDYNIECSKTVYSASKADATFLGWKVTSTGSESNWTQGQTISAGTSLNGKYGDVTLTAQWEGQNADITINVSGLDSNESAIFTVSSGGGVLYTVALSGSNPSVTIKDLPTGVQYTVQATNGWSWAYGIPSPTSYVQNLDASGLVANFTYSKIASAKKHDEKSNVNWQP